MGPPGYEGRRGTVGVVERWGKNRFTSRVIRRATHVRTDAAELMANNEWQKERWALAAGCGAAQFARET